MPTKPTDTIQQIATDANFSTSPEAAVNGQPTKVALANPAEGFVPGRPVGAAQVNWTLNVVNKFLQWVKEGSNLPSLDAHIVETDSNGIVNAAAVYCPAGTGYTILITAINDEAGSTARAIVGRQDGAGVGVEGKNELGTGTGVLGTNNGTGGDGVYGVAQGTGVGAGVHGRGIGSAKASIWADRSSGDNDMPALVVTGNNATPSRGLVSIGQQTDEPSNAFLGDIYVSGVDYRIGIGGTWRTIGHRPEGWLDLVEADNGGPYSIGTTWEDLESITFTPNRVGEIVITCSINCLNPGGSASGFELRIYDSTAATALILDDLGPTDGHRVLRYTYTLPNTSPRTLLFQGQGVGANITVNYATMTVAGIY